MNIFGCFKPFCKHNEDIIHSTPRMNSLHHSQKTNLKLQYLNYIIDYERSNEYREINELHSNQKIIIINHTHPKHISKIRLYIIYNYSKGHKYKKIRNLV